MECVSTFGGPQVLLPTADISRWIDALGDSTPTPDDGLYGMACAIDDYCGIINPWGTPILVFGDIPADIYFFPHLRGGVFARWVAADDFDSFAAFVARESLVRDWPYCTQWPVVDSDLTLMDSCTTYRDARFRLPRWHPLGLFTLRVRRE